jgi:hypothetical protein
VNNRLERLVEELRVAINDSISESDQIPGVIAQIEGSGYHILLFLNATIAVMKREEEAAGPLARTNGTAESRFNSEDVQFLKSMHISMNRRSTGGRRSPALAAMGV